MILIFFDSHKMLFSTTFCVFRFVLNFRDFSLFSVLQ